MEDFPTEAVIPALAQDIGINSLTASSYSPSENWASGEATPATSAPGSRGESPEPHGQAALGNRQARTETVIALPIVPHVKSICFVGAGFVGEILDYPHVSIYSGLTCN